jgi:hypothetical protein
MAAMNYNIGSMLLARMGGDWGSLTMRLQGADRETVIQAIKELDEIELIHIWESSQPDEGAA